MAARSVDSRPLTSRPRYFCRGLVMNGLRCRCRRHRAFTLVELLVVIAIIAVLTALLLPTLAGVNEVGRRTRCQSNLRQIVLAFRMYSEANAGDFPSGAQKGT